MGGMVSGIIRASNPPTVGFFYRFFTPLLMRSPCGRTLFSFCRMYYYATDDLP
jgi:hypothetical protein